ncbi:MAG: response regulator, partial [candidate division Zixibacteria bacterium]|nr:response regulator [candidate division Zixibacteria bacterium]
NPFFTTKRENGAGLGLSAAQGIVAKLGGVIETTANPSGRGTVFRTSFPVVDPIEMEPEEPVESSTSERSLNIMVVDDDEHIRGVLADMLTLIGQVSHKFPDAQKALDAFEAGKYDLVITDLGMPGMSGIELTSHLKKIQPDIPVALVTGWGAQLAENDILSKGIFEIVPKPFHLEDIRSLVTHVMG